MWRSGWRTTAAATTGPARQPRPTSSTPATCTNPTRRSAFSSVRIAGTRVIKLEVQLLTLFSGVLHPGGLALQVAQVVKLRAADFRRARHFHLLDRRRMQRKDALHALPERYLPHGERRARTAA